MASACVNNIGLSPENLPYSSYGWLSPRISFSREYDEADSKKISKSTASVGGALSPLEKKPDLESSSSKDAGDFEFRLDYPVNMLPADELFSDGKLVPLHFSSLRAAASTVTPAEEGSSPETGKSSRRGDSLSIMSNDPYLFSPKAPRCSSRWREILGLKKSGKTTSFSAPVTTTSTSTSTSTTTGKSIRLNFLQRNSKTTSSSANSNNSDAASLSLPLLKDLECESVCISSSRLSLSSSSSSGYDHDDLPRLSLDSEKPKNPNHPNPARVRMVKPRMVQVVENPRPLIDHPSAPTRAGRSPMRRAHQDRGVSVDSPRMNSSGRVVFQSLERSSSSPSTFNGGPRHKHRGMERSYSANVVRVSPVLNVPVCSLRGLFSSSQPQKKEGNSGTNTSSRNHHHHHQNNNSSRNRKESS